MTCCNPERILMGWKDIKAHLAEIQADNIIGISSSALNRYVNHYGFPTFKTRYGRVAANTASIQLWFLKFQNTQDWWKNGRTGRRGQAWEKYRREFKDQIIDNQEAKVL